MSDHCCEYCEKDMRRAKGCIVTEFEADDGTIYQRVPYGHEADGYGFPLPPRCHDCGARKGGYHHPGCDMAICGHCGGQELGCDMAPEDRVEDALATALADQHHSTRVEMGTRAAWIDDDLVPLIRACWTLDIDTEYSCQDDEGWCYVQFGSSTDAARFVAALADTVEDADLRSRMLRLPGDAPEHAIYQEMARAHNWEYMGSGWERWWEQAWEYECRLCVARTPRREAIGIPVTVRWPRPDLPAISSALLAVAGLDD